MKRFLLVLLLVALPLRAGIALAEPRLDSDCSETLLKLQEEITMLRAEMNLLRAQADMLYWENKIQIGCTKAFMKVHGLHPVSVPSDEEMDEWFQNRDQAKARFNRELEQFEAVKRLLKRNESYAKLE
jgi:hypothetical protein